MGKISKKLAWLAIIMLISFIVSGFFFLKSGLMDFEIGGVHDSVIEDLEIFSAKMNKMLNIPSNEIQKELVEESENLEKPQTL